MSFLKLPIYLLDDGHHDFNKFQLEPVLKAIGHLISDEGLEVYLINVILTSDNNLLKINQDYLNHDYLTDVITFDYSEQNKLHAEIYISVDRVLENAATYKTAPLQEFNRIVLHGILHLCGYQDNNEERKQKMTERENHYLSKVITS